MASIKIHQDIANFERKRKGFTSRQIVCIALAVVCIALGQGIFTILLEFSFDIGLYIGIIPAMACILCAFFPVGNMHFEEFAAYVIAHWKRGPYVLFTPEKTEILNRTPTTKKGGFTSRAYQKKCRKKGFECIESRIQK